MYIYVYMYILIGRFKSNYYKNYYWRGRTESRGCFRTRDCGVEPTHTGYLLHRLGDMSASESIAEWKSRRAYLHQHSTQVS